jgi:hypothetical protein
MWEMGLSDRQPDDAAKRVAPALKAGILGN